MQTIQRITRSVLCTTHRSLFTRNFSSHPPSSSTTYTSDEHQPSNEEIKAMRQKFHDFVDGKKPYSDYKLRMDEHGALWVDPRPDKLRKISAERNDDGDMIGQYEGEEVIFPDLEPTLEWSLS